MLIPMKYKWWNKTKFTAIFSPVLRENGVLFQGLFFRELLSLPNPHHCGVLSAKKWQISTKGVVKWWKGSRK